MPIEDTLGKKVEWNKKAKKEIADFEFMRYSAEARALSTLSQERPLTEQEFIRYKEVAKKIGIVV